tara:strand:+ start:1071 stop:1613 length:543 start_codon:yes stop_codon:yes gene_type:complete
MAKVKLKFPKHLWTKADTVRLAQNTLASIKLRTSKGLDADDTNFDKYSTKAIYIPIGKGTGARLKPKGGRVSRTGKSVFYQDGYRQYKHESRKRGGQNPNQDDSAEVDLILSGALMNNLVITKTTQTSFKIGLTSHVKYYGYHVNEKREFIGLSQKDVKILTQTVQDEIRRKLESEGKKK